LEAVDPAVELRVCEHRLDHRFAFAVEPAPEIGFKHAAHEGVEAAVPSGPAPFRLLASGGTIT
jgi:hypothetical protein